MLGGLHGLGLDEEGTGETLGTGIVARLGEHHGEVFLLATLIGVEQTHVALAATPKDIVLATQLDGGINGILDLHRCACYHVKVGVGGCTIHVALVSEHVGRAPQQLDACLLLLLLGIGHNFLEFGFVLLDAVALAHEVHIMEAVVADPNLLHELEACIQFVLGCLHGVGGGVPGKVLGSATKLVGPLST